MDGPRVIATAAGRVQTVDAHLPTDVLALNDGSVWLLDSYGGALLTRRDADNWHKQSIPAMSGATRLSRGEGNTVWLTHPNGTLRQYSSEGAELGSVEVAIFEDSPSCLPMDVAQNGQALTVLCREGALQSIDLTTQAQRKVGGVVSQGALGVMATDLEALPDGGWLVVDAARPGVHRLNRDGETVQVFGSYGLWVDGLSQPRSVALGPEGSVLVADRELGVVQAFDLESGAPLGALASNDTILRPHAPIAVRNGATPGTWLVLGGAPAELLEVGVTSDAILRARSQKDLRALRTPLVQERKAGDRDTCAECHDGLVVDGRAVFDHNLLFHPVDIVPVKHIPEQFRLSDDGKVTCRTCHSPHAASEEGASPFLRDVKDADALCIGCHTEDAHNAALVQAGGVGSAHPSGLELEIRMEEEGMDAGREACLSCHAVHGAVEKPLQRNAGDDSNCLGCHTDRADARHNHTLPDVSVVGAGEPSGCRSCHDLVGGSDTALLRHTEGDALCSDCHTEAQGTHEPIALTSGPHAQLSSSAGPACLQCHDVHGAAISTHMLEKGDSNATCTSCHGSGQSQHRDVTAVGAHAGIADGPECVACHDPHDANPDRKACVDCHEEPAKATERGGHGTATCVDCHPVHSANVAAVGGPDATCRSCHGRGGDAKTVDMPKHPRFETGPDLPRWDALAGIDLYTDSGAPLSAEAGGLLTCRSCHEVHGPSATEPGDHLRKSGVSSTCAACHGDDALLLFRYFHQPDRRPKVEVR